MPAGEGLKRVRVIEASVDETIEIRWRRRIQGSAGDPKIPIDTILPIRYSAPPTSTWDARTKEPEPE